MFDKLSYDDGQVYHNGLLQLEFKSGMQVKNHYHGHKQIFSRFKTHFKIGFLHINVV